MDLLKDSYFQKLLSQNFAMYIAIDIIFTIKLNSFYAF